MKTAWLYPRVKNFRNILPFLILGGVLGAVFGITADQITYTISPEYYTYHKFIQFSFADFGLPPRIFIIIIGCLAGGSAGVVLSWLPARIRFNSENTGTAGKDVFRYQLRIIIWAAAGGILGCAAGLIHTRVFGISSFMGWEDLIPGSELPCFAITGYMHNLAYLGGFTGLITSVIRLKRAAIINEAE